jgi:hypothetical protein
MYVEGVDAKVLRIIRTLLLELSDAYDNLFDLYLKVNCRRGGKDG